LQLTKFKNKNICFGLKIYQEREILLWIKNLSETRNFVLD